jgi:hypothetical protein
MATAALGVDLDELDGEDPGTLRVSTFRRSDARLSGERRPL